MTVLSSSPRIFVPGKVIQIRDGQNPLVVSKLAFVSVEEHVRHVAEMLEWLFPDASAEQRAAARLHDVHKKVGARFDFLRECGFNRAPTSDQLLADFYGNGKDQPTLSPGDAAQAFLKFVRGPGRMRLWPVRAGDASVKEVRLDLDAPFGNHAADATEGDLLPYTDGSFTIEDASVRCSYILNLVRLHHSFQPDRMISACAEHGEQLARDLYRLIVADHAGSRWAEYVVQQLEQGAERPDQTDFFGDVRIEALAEAARGINDVLQAGIVRLRRSRCSTDKAEPPHKELLVRYHSETVNWDLLRLVEDASGVQKSRPQQPGSRRRHARRTRL